MQRAWKPWLESLESRDVPSAAPTQFNLEAMRTPVAWATANAPNDFSSNQAMIGDFTGDGVDDTAVLDTTGTWRVFTSERNGFSASNWGHWIGSWHKFAVADVDADGRDDIVGLTSSGGWVVGHSDGDSFVPSTIAVGVVDVWNDFFVGDFNGDGHDDVLAWKTDATWWMFRSAGASMQPMELGIDWGETRHWTTLQVGDFDGDGRADVAGLKHMAEWWIVRGNAWTLKSQRWTLSWFPISAWHSFHAADVDGDGKTDLLGLGANGSWYLAHAQSGAFQKSLWSTDWLAGTVWRSIVTLDVNDDDRIDVVGWHQSGAFWLLASGPTPTRTVLAWSGLFGPPSRVSVGEFNGDGRRDLLVQTADGKLFAGLNTGTHFLFGVTAPKPFFFIAPWDMNAIRLHPDTASTLFQRYLPALKAKLGDSFQNLSDNMYAIVFANIFAFQHASYFGVGDPGTLPDSRDLLGQLAAPKLECNQYDLLTVQIYRKIVPDAVHDTLDIRWVGWDGGTVGNHSQLVVIEEDLSLLVDPNLALIALVDLDSLRNGTPVPAARIAELSLRLEVNDFMEASLNQFRANVKRALLQGLYPESTFLYDNSADVYLGFR